MNAIPGRIISAEAGQEPKGPSVLDEMHILRSKYVEASATAERHILNLLRSRGGEERCQPKALLSNKIQALRDAIEARKQPARGDKTILGLLDELCALSDLRSELVHSTMSQATLDGQPVVLLRNAGEIHPILDKCVIVSLEGLKPVCRRLGEISNQLKQLAA